MSDDRSHRNRRVLKPSQENKNPFTFKQQEEQISASVQLQPQPSPPTKTKSVWTRFLERLTRPGSMEVNEETMQQYRDKIRENHEMLKHRKEAKRIRRDKIKFRQREYLGGVTSNTKIHHRGGSNRSTQTQTSNIIMMKGSDGVIRSVERINSSASSIYIIGKRPTSSQSIQDSIMSEDDTRYQRYLQRNESAPSHVAAMNLNDELLQKWKDRKRRKKISQLYTGDDVYHHDLSSMWEHTGLSSKFYDKFDEQKRKKYPVTQTIQLKLDKIREDKFRKGMKQRGKLLSWFVRNFYKTNIGYVFKTTPRYYKMTPVTPTHCRRCKNLLEDTLEARWTPIGIALCCLFPIIGFLCYLANREFVCVVCEEIYLYGDYPSKLRPMDKNRKDSDLHVQLKKTSINKKLKMNA